VTSKLNLAAGYYQVDQNNYSNHAAFANQAASGKSKYDSILVDYHFTKAVDCYLGYMVNVVSGGMANSGAAGTKVAANYIYSNNSIIGLGGRLKF
jgi:predicted porin